MEIGFIGSGNMANAIIGGLLNSKFILPNNINVSSIDEGALKNIKKKYNVNVFKDNKEIAVKSDIIILAVKPYLYEKISKEIKDSIKKTVTIVSIAPSKSISQIESYFEKDIKIARAMPNTPALVGEGMTGLCFNNLVTYDERKIIYDIFNSIGKCEIVDEKLISTVVAVSGSSPAYAYIFIEALADGAVRTGMSRDKAYIFAAQALLGSAKMVLETGEHPAVLKDRVCSPGGTTIEAVAQLEKNGFRNAILEAMDKCFNKAN